MSALDPIKSLRFFARLWRIAVFAAAVVAASLVSIEPAAAQSDDDRREQERRDEEYERQREDDEYYRQKEEDEYYERREEDEYYEEKERREREAAEREEREESERTRRRRQQEEAEAAEEQTRQSVEALERTTEQVMRSQGYGGMAPLMREWMASGYEQWLVLATVDIIKAEAWYKQRTGRYGTLKELMDARVLHGGVFMVGAAYKFQLVRATRDSFEFVAVPVSKYGRYGLRFGEDRKIWFVKGTRPPARRGVGSLYVGEETDRAGVVRVPASPEAERQARAEDLARRGYAPNGNRFENARADGHVLADRLSRARRGEDPYSDPPGMVSQEASAYRALKALSSALVEFRRRAGRYGTAREMHAAGLLAACYVSGVPSLDYTIEEDFRGAAFRLTARPKPELIGLRVFSVTEAGQVTVTENGREVAFAPARKAANGTVAASGAKPGAPEGAPKGAKPDVPSGTTGESGKAVKKSSKAEKAARIGLGLADIFLRKRN